MQRFRVMGMYVVVVVTVLGCAVASVATMRTPSAVSPSRVSGSNGLRYERLGRNAEGRSLGGAKRLAIG
jgi:hypothetical protein